MKQLCFLKLAFSTWRYLIWKRWHLLCYCPALAPWYTLPFQMSLKYWERHKEKSLPLVSEFHTAMLTENYLFSTKLSWPGVWHLKCQKSQYNTSKVLTLRTTQMTLTVIYNEYRGNTALPVVPHYTLFWPKYPLDFTCILYAWVGVTSLKPYWCL